MPLSNKRRIPLGEINWIFLCTLGSEEKDGVFARHRCIYGDYEKCNELRESHDLHLHF